MSLCGCGAVLDKRDLTTSPLYGALFDCVWCDHCGIDSVRCKICSERINMYSVNIGRMLYHLGNCRGLITARPPRGSIKYHINLYDGSDIDFYSFGIFIIIPEKIPRYIIAMMSLSHRDRIMQIFKYHLGEDLENSILTDQELSASGSIDLVIKRYDDTDLERDVINFIMKQEDYACAICGMLFECFPLEEIFISHMRLHFQ